MLIIFLSYLTRAMTKVPVDEIDVIDDKNLIRLLKETASKKH